MKILKNKKEWIEATKKEHIYYRGDGGDVVVVVGEGSHSERGPIDPSGSKIEKVEEKEENQSEEDWDGEYEGTV